MRSLLSKRDQRHLDFLELLMENNPVSLNKASELTGYPSRTLATDMLHINAYLSPIKIETSVLGLSLSIPARSSVREVYSLVLKQSREYQFLMYLLYNEGKSQEDIVEDLFISISTFRRMVKTMNDQLQSRNIQINSAPFRVEGDEAQISQLYIALFSELYCDGTSFMTPSQQEILLTLCQKISELGKLELNYPDMMRLHLWIYVFLMRIQRKHHISTAVGKTYALDPNHLFDEAYLLRFKEVFKVALDQSLLYELFHLFLRPEFATTQEEINPLRHLSPYHRKLDNSIQTLLNEIAQELNISASDTEKLHLDLFNILQFAKNPPSILYSKSKIFVREFFHDNQPLASVIMDKIHQVYASILSEDGMAEVFYLLATHWPSLLEKIKENAPKISIGVFFDSDIEHAQMIADLISQHSKMSVQVLVTPLSSMQALGSLCLNQNISLLLTNIPHLNVPCQEMICIQEYPTARDLRNIILAEERIYQKKISIRKEEAFPEKAAL